MDRRGSGFKKIISDYRTRPNYSEKLVPEFYSDNDSFLLILKNINYYTAIGEGRRKLSKRTTEHIDRIEAYLREHNGARTKDVALFIGLSDARTRVILNEMDNVTSTGENSARRYWLKR